MSGICVCKNQTGKTSTRTMLSIRPRKDLVRALDVGSDVGKMASLQ